MFCTTTHVGQIPNFHGIESAVISYFTTFTNSQFFDLFAPTYLTIGPRFGIAKLVIITGFRVIK
jgi:hypothetical protein